MKMEVPLWRSEGLFVPDTQTHTRTLLTLASASKVQQTGVCISGRHSTVMT